MRTVLYAAIIAIVGGIMLYALATRDSEGISVIHDRNPMFVRLSDGALRNDYTIRIVNKRLKSRDFIIRRRRPAVDAGRLHRRAAAPRRTAADQCRPRPDPRSPRAVTDYGTTPPPPSTTILFRLIDIDTGEVAEVRDHFFGP